MAGASQAISRAGLLPNERLKLAGAGGNEELCWLASEASIDSATYLQLATRIAARELPETPSHSIATPCYGPDRDAMDLGASRVGLWPRRTLRVTRQAMQCEARGRQDPPKGLDPQRRTAFNASFEARHNATA